jgi:hypothetical protein
VTVNEPPDICKPNAIPLKLFSTVQALKHAKDFVNVLSVKSYTLIPTQNTTLRSLLVL